MDPSAGKSDAGDKADIGRPRIILRTLPAFSFATPTYSVNVQFSFHTTFQDKLSVMAQAAPGSPAASSRYTFGSSELVPAPPPGRSTPSSVSSIDFEKLHGYVNQLLQQSTDTQKDVEDLGRKVVELEGQLKSKVAGLEQRINEMDKKLDQVLVMLGQPQLARASFSTPDLHEHESRRRGPGGGSVRVVFDRLKSAFSRVKSEAEGGLRELEEQERQEQAASHSQQQVAGPSTQNVSRAQQRDLLGQRIQPDRR
ncbi:hypothetical protein BD414DRAFT_501620 [Trametes punicea]|nr:hypothetical protein BD414DRAFT_501620 [Trametes punicea]